MPRPRKLNQLTIVTFGIDYEDYLLLRELAQRKGISLSELLREIIDDYLARCQLKEKKIVAQDSGFSIMKTIEYTLLISELEECLPYLRRYVNILKSSIPKSPKWLDAKRKSTKLIKKVYAIIQKLGIINNKKVKEAIKLINEFQKCIEPEE